MRLKRPESAESRADPGDSPLRMCTRQCAVLFHTRQNQKESRFAWAGVTRMAVSEPDSDLHPQKTCDV